MPRFKKARRPENMERITWIEKNSCSKDYLLLRSAMDSLVITINFKMTAFQWICLLKNLNSMMYIDKIFKHMGFAPLVYYLISAQR